MRAAAGGFAFCVASARQDAFALASDRQKDPAVCVASDAHGEIRTLDERRFVWPVTHRMSIETCKENRES